MYLSERIAEDGITISTSMIGQTDTHYQWSVTLHRPDGRRFELHDPHESNDEPTAFDVLDLVTGTCNIIDQSADWREWQSEYMPDATPQEERDRIYPRDMFEWWVDINNALRDFLGHQGHEDYLYDTDRSK